jgi:hypothetical protein
MVALALLVGCGAPGPSDSARQPTPTTAEDTGTRSCAIPSDGEWRVLAEPVGTGVLLSAWTIAPQEVLIVGGEPSGAHGTLVHYTPGALCVEPEIIDATLWWVHGPRAGEWYAVGARGTILHAVDGVRTREDVDTTATLYGVWATEDTVWAVGGDPFAPGSGEIWNRTEGQWTLAQGGIDGVPFKVWDGWIVGDNVGYRIDGDTLTAVPQHDRLLTVRGRDPLDVYAVGGVANALMKTWDGEAWVASDTSGLSPPLNGVWTDVGQDLWVAGFSGLTARWTGSSWEQPAPPVSLEQFHAVYGHCDEVLFLGGNLMSGTGNYGSIVRYGTPVPTITPTACP